MPEVDFRSVSAADIVRNFASVGSVLLRNFVEPERLLRLKEMLDGVYDEINHFHVFGEDLAKRGLPGIHDYVGSEKLSSLLESVFLNAPFHVYHQTCARRVAPKGLRGSEKAWLPPLGPHIDATVHSFRFTTNFWIPLQPCGIDAPSLGVVCVPFDEVIEFLGYDGKPAVNGGRDVWNFPRFNALTKQLYEKAPEAIAALKARYADQIWTPSYQLGDAMMISNWTLHFSHSTENMRGRRENVELRFISSLSFEEFRQRDDSKTQAALAATNES